jgi:hypothetical protein
MTMTVDKPVSRALSTAFLAAALLLLVAGLYLFVFAESVATLPAGARAGNPWPWPIGPLALRFVASLVLSAVVACFLVSRRPDRPTVSAFFNVTAIVSGALLLHALVNLAVIDWSKPFSYVWYAILALALAGSIYAIVRLRAGGTTSEQALPATPKVARWIALFIFFLTGIVGLVMFLLPDTGRERWPWDLANSTNVQLLGAVFISVSLSSGLAWLQPSWYGYDNFYPTAGTFATVALIASFMHWNLFAVRPITSWVFVAIYILGLVMGFYPYLRYVLGRSPVVEPQASHS